MAQPKSKPKAIDALKQSVSPGSVAGKLRDRKTKLDAALKSMGAKAGSTSAKPKMKTRMA